MKKKFFDPVNEWYFGYTVCRLENIEKTPVCQKAMKRGGSLGDLSKRAKHNELKRLHKEKCRICQKAMKKNENLVTFFQCGHNLHEKCLDLWVGQFIKNSGNGFGSKQVFCPTCNKNSLN